MKGKNKKSALLFIIVMFAVLGMLSIGNESFADDKETITSQQVVTDSATYENKIFTVNSSNSDGAIYVENGELTVTNSDFINSSAKYYGGGISTFNGKKISVSGSIFTGNTAGEYGGAIYNDSVAEISNSSFTGNSSYKEGGAIWNENSLTILANTVFEENIAADIGGAICNSLKAEQLTIEKGVIFKNNVSNHDGGAIGNYSGAIIAEGAKFIGNKAQTGTSDTDAIGGGAISLGAKSSLSIKNAEFTNNESGYNGGAIGTRSGLTANNSSAKLDVLNSTFTGNKATGTATSTSAGQTLKGGNGGAIDNHFYNSETNSGYVTVAGSTFASNTAINGGAIYNHGEKDKAGNAAAIKITNSTFTGNQATSDGGAIANAGNAIISGNTSFESNAAKFGGAITNAASMTISGNSSFESNTANYGGAIFNYSILNVLSDSSFAKNTATSNGGAIYNYYGNATIDGAKFEENKAISGGAIYNTKGTTSIANSTFNTNSATAEGGAISNTSGTVEVVDSSFTGNTATNQGGAIYNAGKLNISGTNSSFEGNSTAYLGGAILNAGTAIIEDAIFAGNKVTNEVGMGGAIYNTNNLTVNDATFKENNAANRGGGIYNESVANINGSTFEGNTAKEGGAIYNYVKATVIDSTFTDNKATSKGGAIYNAGELTVKNSTFSGNTDSTGKNDIYNDGEMSLAGEVNFDGGITGDGSTSVLADAIVDNSNGTLTQTSVSVADRANLKTNVAKINVANGINNAGTVTLTGNGEITTTFTGTGSLALDTDGTIALNDLNLIGNSDVSVNNGIFSVGKNVTNLTNKLSFKDDTTLNIMNDAVNNVSNINILGENSELTLLIDFNDKIDKTTTTSFGDGSFITLQKINLNGVTTSSESQLTTSLGQYIDLAMDTEFIKGDSAYNYVTLVKSEDTATLKANNSFLNSAVRETVTSQRVYNMSESETVTTAQMKGTLVVNGNGQTISTAENTSGGITLVEEAELSLVDVNINNFVLGDDKAAITVNEGSNFAIVAKNNDVTISNIIGNEVNNAIYLLGGEDDDDAAAAYIVTENAARTITIENDISSNSAKNMLVFGGDGTVVLNGVLDPLTALVNGNVKVQKNNYDSAIQWQLDGGTLAYSNDKYLYDAVNHNGTTYELNSITFNGGNLNLMNGVASNIKLGSLALANNSNLYLDVDLANATMDRFSDDTAVTYSSGTLNIAGLNLISDTAQEYTSINFTNNEDLKGHVAYTGSHTVSKALSPIYKYDVDYNNQTGNFGFRRAGHNPSIYAGAVGAQVGSYLGQLNVYEQAFANMDMLMLMSKEQRMAMKYANKYAASTSDLIYDGTKQIPEQVAGGWFRPFATFENVGLKGGINVQNIAYGSLFGGDSEIHELGHGWDAVVTPYVGYLGSHQSYDGVGIYQNGGVLGLSSAFYKGNFFTGLTANAGANVGEASTMYGNDTFTMLTAGIASKTGYNWELAKGKFIIQPSLLLSYTFVNTFNYRAASGVGINSDPIHGIQVAPGVKFIGNLKNGWQPYVGIQMVWNIVDQTRFQANEVALEQLSVRPYIQYGVGVQKRWGERFTGFGQAMIRNGGRNGVALSVGFRWALGKESASNTTKTKDFSYNPKTNINLSSLNR